MRKPRDFDAELKALEDKARELKTRKVQQLGDLVIATGADTLTVEELAGALLVLGETKDLDGRKPGRDGARRSFKEGHADLQRHLNATRSALRRNQTARTRHQAARARHDMRDWQIERRKRTRHLIELGGLVVKSGVVELTGDDRVVIYGALLWIADQLRSEERERARSFWTAMGTQGFEEGRHE